MCYKIDYVPRTSILNNGEIVTFQLLEKSHEAPLKTFFSQVSKEEAEFLRDDVRDPKVISKWFENLDYHWTIPLVAWDESSKNIVGVSSLHRMAGVQQHVAEIRIFVGKDHRKLGLGSVMIKELIEIGTQMGLYFLKAKILTDNRLAVKAFRQLGFECKCTLEDYFITPKGQTRDVMLMLRRLKVNMEEDFFYVF